MSPGKNTHSFDKRRGNERRRGYNLRSATLRISCKSGYVVHYVLISERLVFVSLCNFVLCTWNYKCVRVSAVERRFETNFLRCIFILSLCVPIPSYLKVGLLKSKVMPFYFIFPSSLLFIKNTYRHIITLCLPSLPVNPINSSSACFFYFI